MAKKKCTICGIPKSISDYTRKHSVCKSCRSSVAKAEDEGVITIPYEPDREGKAWVNGVDVRVARKMAGIATTYDMSMMCKWSQTCQVKYEKLTRHLIDMENIWKMIRVCNGER